jgi:hypothetical protein
MSSTKQLLVLGIILLAGLVVRLYKIDNPVADWHSWRQADTSAVTRNFVRHGVDLFHPQYDDLIDISGKGLFNPNGYRFVEFPLFNLVHYLFAEAFPIKSLEFWGRMTSIVSALVSAAIIFKLVSRRINHFSAVMASLFYLFLPFNIYFTRVILPDPLMVTLWLASLYSLDLKHFKLAWILAALAILVKPMAIFFLIPVFVADTKLVSNWKTLAVCLAAALPFAIWRGYSHLFPQGMPTNMWMLNGNGIRFRPAWFRWLFGERLGKLFLGSWGVWPFLTGLLESGWYFAAWGIGGLIYLVVFATGNVWHDYYQIPLMPVISIYLAIGFVNLWKRSSLYKLSAIASTVFMLAFSGYEVKGLYNVNHWAIVNAGRVVDATVPKDAIVIAPYNGDTAFLYQTNRRGFSLVTLPIKDYIDRFHATYYVSVNYDDQTRAVMDQYITITETPEYVLVKLIERPDYWERRRAREAQQL